MHRSLRYGFAALLLAASCCAYALEAGVQAKVTAKMKDVQSWAADASVVAAVKAGNAQMDASALIMTQEKWQALTVLDPFVRGFSKNPAGEFLKSKKDDTVSEAFLSAADGTKVAFITKPSNWNHRGKPKHDAPMSGKTWQGAVEVDASTGLEQLQVAVPVLDGGKPIGVLVVGLTLSKLKN